MIVDVSKYESFFTATGGGSFSNVEYADNGTVILRTDTVKTTDLSGAVRLYFDARREQVLSGRRYDLMGSGLILMRPGAFYRIQTTLVIREPLPEDIYVLPVLHADIEDVMAITTGPIRGGYVGPVCFTVQPYRKIEAEKLTSFATLMVFREPSEEWLLSVTGKSSTGSSAKAKPSKRAGVAIPKNEEVSLEGSVSDERSDAVS